MCLWDILQNQYEDIVRHNVGLPLLLLLYNKLGNKVDDENDMSSFSVIKLKNVTILFKL